MLSPSTRSAPMRCLTRRQEESSRMRRFSMIALVLVALVLPTPAGGTRREPNDAVRGAQRVIAPPP